ncbi:MULTISPECIES: polysaccharide deacetylase family protein [unclassified Nocardioides]|uniref:polysaccharide deacetylase family protein n=1 Tax=Nocardioides sp. URHA0032 TaxID=1380388 RepID=UPI0018CC6172|nr:polysaccharide deacetylase family protein [Nocardioides sp. URHA0032]
MRLVLVALLVALVAAVLVPAPATAAPARPCSRGLVALTFDDGPLASVTPRVVRLLVRLDVPATFFMVGDRVAAHPELVRLVDRAGFAIGNHTWAHTDLTTQTPAEARHALVTTRHALLDAGVQPTDLARPPYGAVDDRVRRVMAGLGLVPTLWTIDSRDWTGLSPRRIANGVVGHVRRHRINVVLQHDGVTNSPATVRALPHEIATLQQRGYCFASLDAHGEPAAPVPVISVSPDRRRITEGDRVRLTVRLDRPTTRATRVHTAAGSVEVAAGRQVAHLWFRAPQDRADERPEDVTVFAGTVVRVVDDDPPPVVSVVDATVTASPLVPVAATVAVHLDRPRDRPTRVVVRSDLGPARITVPAFSRHGVGTVSVPATARGREVALHAAGASSATLTIEPSGRTWLEAARAAVARVRWPDVRVRPIF